MGNSSNYSRQKIQYVLTIFLFFITSSLFSQTVIREKIIINPEKKNKAELSRTETSSESIVIKWKDTTVSVSFLVSSPCDEQVYIPWHTGTSFSYSFSTTSTGYYGVQIRMNFQRMVPVEVDYSFQTGESGTIVIQPNLSGNFSFANLYGYYESINDFYLGFTNSVICDENSVVRLAPYIINNYNCESNAPFNSLSPATVKLESELDCYLFNSKEQTELGKISEINLGKLKDIEIRLRNKYEGTERKIIEVKLQVGDITRNREVIVEGKGNYQLYYYYAEDEDERILPGIKKLLEVEAYSDNYCNSYLLPDSTKFNVEIISGEQYGVCKELENGIEGKILIGLNHQEGILKFLFSSNGEILSGKDSIKVRVWTTDNKIKPIEIPLVILQPRIKVIFSPANIMPGDTADVVLKKIDDSGNIVDFEEEQRFDVKIVDGREYGDLFIPQWEEITDESWYVEQGFKFIASSPIENLPVESVLMVKTSEGFAGSKLPVDRSQKEDYKKHSMSFIKRTNQLQKSNTTENNKPPDINKSMMIGDPEELWGIGKIIIGHGNDCSDAPQCEGESEVPSVEINPIYKNGDFGIDSCNSFIKPYGLFLPLTSDKNSRNTFENYEMDVCYNTEKDKWQDQILGNKLKIRAIKDICLDNLLNDSTKIIYNINQIQQKVKNKEEAWVAFVKFFNHLSYPVATDFLILDFIINHEEIHMNQYVKYVIPLAIHPDKGFYFNSRTYKDFKELFSDIGPSCEDSPNIEWAKNHLKTSLEKILNLLRKELKDAYKWGGTWANESNINSFISQRKIILQYQEELIRLFPEIKEHIQFADYYVKGI